jgi:hypothetical protein
MFFQDFGEHQDIVEIYYHKDIEVFFQYIEDKPLEYSGYIYESK